MRKAAITLIVIGLLVVIGANLFIGSQPEPEPMPIRDETTIRDTTAGPVVGFKDKFGARAWMGIPFAKAPVDDLRWRSPQDPSPDIEVREALAPGQICPQFSSLLSGGGETSSGGVVGSEDCLYLNVWSPPNAVDLPVMFWIHGGGNTIGDGGSYNGSALAANREVVVVTINYRLGLMGWFAHPALETGNPEDDSGNYGTLDVVRALEWVQENIGEFGGDPGNVTVFGESAGAFDTLAMMASPLAEGLFHRAIVQSGGFTPAPMAQAQNYESEGGHAFSSKEVVAKMLVADGRAPNHEAAVDRQASMSDREIREYLYSKPADQFFRIFENSGFGMVNVPDNFGDGHVLPAMTTEEIFSSAENHNMVPVILGTNRDESALFMVRDPRYVENWLGFLPRLKDEATYLRVVKYSSLAWKVRGVDSLATYMTAAGNPDVYAYRFDWDEEPSQAGFDLSKALGAAHALEIPFAFGDFEGGIGLSYLYPNDEAQYALADSMTSYWSEFAYSGNPGTGREGKQVAWLPWGTDGKRSIILDSPNDQGIFMDDQLVTVESVKAELAADDGFGDLSAQCGVYVRSFRDAFDQAEYEAVNSECANIPPSEFAGF